MNRKEFDLEKDALVFAIQRVVEYWIVHCYPQGDKWVVSWWCQ